MYTIEHNQKEQIVELKNSKSYAKIYLALGASLQELMLNDEKIIQDLYPLEYKDTYASSILFPFVSRVKDGIYTYNGNEYQLEKNEEAAQNALHGLIYNKTFQIVSQSSSENEAVVTLQYEERNESIGFPYTYNIQVSYTLSKDKLIVGVNIKNTDTKSFPFTLGWHPYFISENLADSSIKFNSTNKLIIGDGLIAKGFESIENVDSFLIGNEHLDDCWQLDTDKVVFKTSGYDLEFVSTAKKNYLQLYTPPKKNTIAIEPTTGVSNSLNNKIGLQKLVAGETYELQWSLCINS